uniref:RNA-directed DNA polymerase, eukaryota, reverse transcriptase zinc-binding domain protein n=1 Tax=Tanacetum cinerariifolium TaxID=118510 RepID=A0A6L2L230_TANCI|nr:RNA-directed DNA polymerase, eukaryota, reverse transcriptase zinc-binding domain protein [Tanacetum cinerariifolium]
MREKGYASWDRAQRHMGRSGECFGTIQVSCRCTGELILRLWNFDKWSFNVALFDEKLLPDPALSCSCDEDGNMSEIPETIFEMDKPINDTQADEPTGMKENQSEDPFNIYPLLNKQKVSNGIKETSVQTLKFPIGFTPPVNEKNVHVDPSLSKESPIKDTSESVCSSHFVAPRSQGSILNLMEELIKVGQTMGYNMDRCLNNLTQIIESQGEAANGEVVIMGDFNEVRLKSNRFGLVFNVQGANAFNSFIANAGLEEVPLGGSSFTWCHKSATKMNKLDRFLISENLLISCPNITAITLDRYLSDHRPILLRESWFDYGPIPFRFYHHWIEIDGKAKFKEDLKSLDAEIDNGDGSAEKVLKRAKEMKTLISFMIDLECEATKEELKKVVWDCGTDKSPGLDGYTFGFFRRFWSTINDDVFEAVKYFFSSGDIPKGCNSSFIVPIPKIPDANLVKDFRPISLIGSIYKIIAKILANRLVGVLRDIINGVQSAFIVDRQILDGMFILNEMLQWCKLKKKHSLIFKVDFEKAFDSIRWDFLDDVLKNFGFGVKWCNWIQSFLSLSRGSILINGSPTKKFGFHKGLKQGDPLSPFLFILVMESLHLSFQRVVDAGMYKGVQLNSSLSLSHMFYADDAIFMGEWCENNINILTLVLDCFHQASGLKINMSKSKIMAWEEVIDKVSSRLSRWKMKALSIEGRLTLLKSILGSMPIFHMSIFKAPLSVLRKLESIRSHFFNGHDQASRKALWIKWDYVLTPKDKGRLGWIGDNTLHNLFPLIYALENKKHVTIRIKLADLSLADSFRRNPRGGDIKNFLKNEKLDQVVAIVKSCSPNVSGDLTVTMKDLPDIIQGKIHHKVIGEGGYGKDIIVGAALILTNVSVFSLKPSMHYLNITMRNVVKIFRKDTVSGSNNG